MSSVSTRIAIITACMLAATGYLFAASRPEVIPARQSLAEMPFAFDGWQGRKEEDFTQEIVAVLGVDDYINRSYVKDRWPVGLYIGYHTSQRQGDTIHSPLNCIPGAGWQPQEVGRLTIPVQGAPGQAGGITTPVEVNRVVIAKGLDRQLVLYWYQSNRRVVANEYRAKVYTVLDAVRYNRTDAALVRVIVPIGQDDPTAQLAEQHGVAFVRTLFPRLGPHLPS